MEEKHIREPVVISGSGGKTRHNKTDVLAIGPG